MKVIGLMSGTSLDGLDVAYCEFFKPYSSSPVRLRDMNAQRLDRDLKAARDYEKHYGNFLQLDTKDLYCNVFAATTYKYPPLLRNKLARLHDSSALEYAQTDVELGHYIGKKVAKFMNSHYGTADLIASHGHTIFHNPASRLTTQIGCGDAIAAETGLPVVFNFRRLDVALGGQGAPLVPMGDQLLFGNYDGCLNLGGIANISYNEVTEKSTQLNSFGKDIYTSCTSITKETKTQRTAFDIVVCNMAMNEVAHGLGKEYDVDGETARSGKVCHELLTALNALKYYKQGAPKSLGKEWYLEHMAPLLDGSALPIAAELSAADLLCTLVEHTAHQIAKVVKTHHLRSLLVTGGGTYNKYLIERMQICINGAARELAPAAKLPCYEEAASSRPVLPKGMCDIVLPHRTVIDYKEAIIFALLGYLRLTCQSNTYSSVTGALCDSMGGDIAGKFQEE